MLSSTTLSHSGSGVARTSAIAVVGGAAAAALYGVLLDVAGVPMRAGGPGATASEPVTPGTFALGTAFLTVIALGIAAVLRGRAARPRRTFLITGWALTALSLPLPLAAGATAASTKAWFAIGHVVLAAMILPVVATALPRAAADSAK
jgi:hypothetical protein